MTEVGQEYHKESDTKGESDTVQENGGENRTGGHPVESSTDRLARLKTIFDAAASGAMPKANGLATKGAPHDH
jgi:hypothetical protein